MWWENKDRVEAMWCIDSESGREYLIDLKSQEILAERVDGKLVNPIRPDICDAK